MRLEEKINKINEPKLEDTIGLLPKGKNDTMDDFFINFVKPRLPKPAIVKEWHKLLMDYTDDLTTLSCCVRYGNSGSPKISDNGESGYYKLRRGWLTQNTVDDFEYFFADNFFSAFIYKMALDGFVPADTNELRDVFRNHKFPYGFGFKIDEKINEYKGVVIDIGKEPGFLNNYKLSHVFDAGEHFLMDDGTVKGDAELSPKYFPIGHSNDFLNEHDKIRKMKIEDEAKKVIVAKFLRFAHPLNYFLTPSKKLHTCATKVYMNDIGEDPVMIHIVKQYLKETYPKEYYEFLDKIMWRDEYVGINYSRPQKGSSKGSKKTGASKTGASKTGAKKVTAPAKSKKGHKSLTQLEAKYTYDKLLEVASYYLCNKSGLNKIEKKLSLTNNRGFEAQNILNVLGINTDGALKGLLLSSNINDEIAKATGTFKTTLEEIKKRGLA